MSAHRENTHTENRIIIIHTYTHIHGWSFMWHCT